MTAPGSWGGGGGGACGACGGCGGCGGCAQRMALSAWCSAYNCTRGVHPVAVAVAVWLCGCVA